jgi:light-harvesting complex I chlorophyll a/b binding protein 1
MFSKIVLALMVVAGVSAFAPAPMHSGAARTASLQALGSGFEGNLVGSDIELGASGWDPAGFSNNCSPSQMAWYRAAELKHGRVAMLAALGYVTVAAGIHFPDPVFTESRPWAALVKVSEERPLALGQIMLGIFAAEALGQAKQSEPGTAPGDLSWDPLELKPQDPEELASMQLRELKNGRLAMLATAAYFWQEDISGMGVFEQINNANINPF